MLRLTRLRWSEVVVLVLPEEVEVEDVVLPLRM